jgi:hypothetical protein
VTPINQHVAGRFFSFELPNWLPTAWMGGEPAAREAVRVGLSDHWTKSFLAAGLLRGQLGAMTWDRALSIADLAMATDATKAKQLAGWLVLAAVESARSVRDQAANSARMAREWTAYQQASRAIYLRNKGRIK